MMRHLHRLKIEISKPARAEPMAEGIRTDKRAYRHWGTDEEVLGIARRIIGENGIRNPKGLEKTDSRLYQVLWRRHLLSEVRFKERKRELGEDSEVLAIARKLIEDKGIRNRKGLVKADPGLHTVLYKRELLDELSFPERREHRMWGTDEEVLRIARKLIDGKGIRNRKELEKADGGLCHVLRDRNLLDELKFQDKQRKWGADEEVLDYAVRLIEDRGIRSREELKRADSGLHTVLNKRKLLDKIGFEERRENRIWGTDEEVIEAAWRLIEQKGVKNRRGLAKADLGLYTVLWKRRLLDQAFAPQDQAKHAQAVHDVLDAMEKFGK